MKLQEHVRNCTGHIKSGPARPMYEDWRTYENDGPKKHIGTHKKPRSKANCREYLSVSYKNFRFKDSGLTFEFRFLVGTGRFGVMIGRLCLSMASQLLIGDEL